MSCLYIGGAQCIHAKFKKENGWQNFDEQKHELQSLAKKFNVEISRYAIDENDFSFVIMHKKADHQCFYESAAFEVDMSVETSDHFESNAQNFVKALNSKNEFNIFHNLTWSTPKILYFVIS